jgi:triosephosphate isomerase
MVAMSRKKLIAANWKMNKTIAEAEAFAADLRRSLGQLPDCELAVYPPFFALPATAKILGDTRVRLGAQDVYWEKSGAYTGEVSCDMVRDAGGSHVVIGHSERRHVLGESNETVAKKLEAVVESGLTAVFCVGEKLEHRESGDEESYVQEQLSTALGDFDTTAMERIIIAYEPVWAIGTGKTATPDDADSMHRFVRSYLGSRFGDESAGTTRILYGGSVKPANAAELLARTDIDGALIGGAALELESYLAIAKAAA